jgi:hypothetical protein
MEASAAIATGHGGRRPGSGPPKGTQYSPRKKKAAADDDGEVVSLGARERLVMARADREEANARIAQIELARLSGSMIHAAEALTSRARQTTAFRARMLAIPSAFCGQFVAPNRLAEAFEVLTAMISEALDELANDGARHKR